MVLPMCVTFFLLPEYVPDIAGSSDSFLVALYLMRQPLAKGGSSQIGSCYDHLLYLPSPFRHLCLFMPLRGPFSLKAGCLGGKCQVCQMARIAKGQNVAHGTRSGVLRLDRWTYLILL
jgi:hypothetical protein